MNNNRSLLIPLAVLVAVLGGLVPTIGAEPTPYDRMDRSLEAVRIQLKNASAKLNQDVKEQLVFKGPTTEDEDQRIRLTEQDIPFPVMDCCQTNIDTIRAESGKLRGNVDELNAALTLENNADGLQAVRNFSKGLDAFDSAVQTFASSNSKPYAQEAYKSVRLVFGEVVKLRTEIDRATGREPADAAKESGAE
jgi:hypothetical protein